LNLRGVWAQEPQGGPDFVKFPVYRPITKHRKAMAMDFEYEEANGRMSDDARLKSAVIARCSGG
jgi:hypothetical protein